MNPIQQIVQYLKTQSKPRQLSLITAIVLIASLTLGLIAWVATPHYGVLFSQLDAGDANQILTQLEQAHINYHVQNQGRDILIESALIDKTRIKLMSSELALSHSVGFELFDKSDFGLTDFSQKMNYQRALQGELERTISSLEAVKHAHVQLTIPEQHLFQQDETQPHAAVTLHLRLPLTTMQVKSIQQLVSASLAQLKPTNVIIVDQNGNGLINDEEDSTSINHRLKSKQAIERYLTQKVMHLLHPVFPPHTVSVNIDATLNYDELQREVVKPQTHGQITHEKETQQSTTTKSEKSPSNQNRTRETSYQFGSETEHFTRANGTIERLTISVVLPQNTSIETVHRVERLVKSGVGFNPQRGDSLSIETLITPNKPQVTHPPAAIKPTTPHLPHPMSVGFAFGLLSVLALTRRYLKRRKQRQRLLLELNQWLLNHD